MSKIIIDSEKCKKDGICIAECPFLLLKEGEDGVPLLIKGAEEACLDCGHCLAICPGEAISLNNVSADDCDVIDQKLEISVAQVEQLFKSRRSIRSYKDTSVDQSVLQSLIDIARWAPSARNAQPVSWIIVNNSDQVYDLAAMVADWFRLKNLLPDVVNAFETGKDMIHREAPCLLVAHAPTDGFRPAEDCTIAISTVETAAPVYGLGACWAGFFLGAAKQHEPILTYLDLPAGHEVYGALMIGHPNYRYRRIPPRAEARVDWR